jgi:c(7)-type cytochrome triheme protein
MTVRGFLAMRVRAAAIAAFALVALAAGAQQPDNRRWLPLDKDGVHDPKSPAVHMLQDPRDALAPLAPDTAGNQVRWMEALTQGQIQPRSRVQQEPHNDVLRETEIFLNLKGGTPIVRFPHRQHTLWLDCANCHDGLFKREVGASALDMRRILQGEQCGLCHGAVAFPLTECNRCHNTSRIGFERPDAAARRSGAALVAPASPAAPAPPK